FISEPRKADPASKRSTWAKLGHSVLTVACACALYVTSASTSGQHNAYGLEFTEELAHKGPMTYFPSKIVWVNKALPDQVHTSGSHVILSDDVSGSPPEVICVFSRIQCSSNGTYISRNSHLAISTVLLPLPKMALRPTRPTPHLALSPRFKFWNVTTPTTSMKSLSWNSRPQRIALMGTVSFLPEKEKIEQLQLQDRWQALMPTRFSCGEKMTVSIEVACEGCELEFEQVLSFPPLGECKQLCHRFEVSD
ncbi:hypothetical protein F4604DRAFT_1760997, partial [Suillus subluteus]